MGGGVERHAQPLFPGHADGVVYAGGLVLQQQQVPGAECGQESVYIRRLQLPVRPAVHDDAVLPPAALDDGMAALAGNTPTL